MADLYRFEFFIISINPNLLIRDLSDLGPPPKQKFENMRSEFCVEQQLLDMLWRLDEVVGRQDVVARAVPEELRQLVGQDLQLEEQ